MQEPKRPGMATRAVHAGERKKPGVFTPVATPIYSSAAFVYDELETIDAIFGGVQTGPTYARHDNPTTTALEEAVAALEEAPVALASASGMASLHLALLAAEAGPGKRILAAQDIYGVTYKLLMEIFMRQGAEVRFGDLHGAAERARQFDEFKPHIVLLESISNPLLHVADVGAVCDEAKQRGARVIVDNTFATPVMLRPATLGADFVVHSSTKYLGGHGDLIGGIACAAQEHAALLRLYSKLLGPISGPFEAWLTLRGIKTLPLRMKRHCANAATVAAWLAAQPGIARVHYPGREDHPDHQLARRLFPEDMYGGLVAFEVRDAEREQIFRFVNALNLCLKATSLGDVQSLILYPAISSHRDLSPAMRKRLGIGDNLLRLSVGIEDPEDIISDLAQALSSIGK